MSVLKIKPATGQISKSSRVLLCSTLEERTPNTVKSRDPMETRYCWYEWMDLGTRIWHPPQIFFEGADDITKKREPGIEIIGRTP